MDFVSDALKCGRRFRTLNIVDDFNREALAIEIDLNLPALRVIRTLERLIAWLGTPSKIRVDNGPEFIAMAIAEWAEEYRILLDFIEPGKPTQNSFIERFQRTYRNELLDIYVFSSLNQLREITDEGMLEYSEDRPRDSLEDLAPNSYLAKYELGKHLIQSVTKQGWLQSDL
ncbi:ISxcC1 transposase [Vibrio sp. N418]|nr:ISxcC1 transposase [Vibrio sp. N418]